jgi:hypothetical protein
MALVLALAFTLVVVVLVVLVLAVLALALTLLLVVLVVTLCGDHAMTGSDVKSTCSRGMGTRLACQHDGHTLGRRGPRGGRGASPSVCARVGTVGLPSVRRW